MVSLLNGLGGLGAGLGAFAGSALKDQVNEADRTARTPLLNSTPSAPAESTPDAATDPIVAAAPPAAGSSVAGVPAEYMPFYEAAAKRTGIPIDVLIAQGKQESNFRPDIIGNAGEIGIHQVKPSTARDPGGMSGIDPATLRDPQTNIDFAADYLKTRAPSGADFSDPAVVDAALRRFNGGGDPRYVENVRAHMGQPPQAAASPVAGRMTDAAWLDQQAKTYPGLGGV